jgi:hypothetical protein
MRIQFNTSVASLAVSSTVKTGFRYNSPSSRSVRITDFTIGDQSVTSTDQPIVGYVYRGRSTDGTGTALTGVVVVPGSGTVIGTAKGNYTVEPTAGSPELLFSFTVPTGGEYVFSENNPTGIQLICALSSNISIELQSAQARALTVPISVTIDE